MGNGKWQLSEKLLHVCMQAHLGPWVKPGKGL